MDGPSPGELATDQRDIPAMTTRPSFQSILFVDPNDAGDLPRTAPAYFHDLNLDQIVDTIAAGKAEYDLKPFFHAPLGTVDAITYRHEVMRDLDEDDTCRCIGSFAERMRRMREQAALANGLHYPGQKHRWFLEAAITYCAAIRGLGDDLGRAPLTSRGLLGFRTYLHGYVASRRFANLDATTQILRQELASIEYCILLRDGGFKVRKYAAERDYSAEIVDTFRKFQQGAADDYQASFHEPRDMNHIEAKVLEFVARLYPGIFTGVAAFRAEHTDFADPIVTRFDREIQFYIGYKDYIAPLKRAGLPFCLPDVSYRAEALCNDDGFDLALAAKLAGAGRPVVRNDWHLTDPERILVVSGPNQGGKTTFARSFGQLHHLAGIGCPVPGRRAVLSLFDALFTHFEREEDIRNQRGKLRDDLVRIHHILERATPRGIVIMNEIFTSTALTDAEFLGRKVMDGIIARGCICVCVTFLDELSRLGNKTVSMVSTIAPENPAIRTYKIIRRPSDGRSHALSIAEKHGVTYERLKARLPDPARSPGTRRP